MKKIYLLLALLLVLTVSGCNKNNVKKTNTNAVDQSTSVNENYEIVKEKYTSGKMMVNYPQIKNLNDENKQKKINELIKAEALKIQDEYKEDMDNIDLNLDYEVMHKGSDIISVKYLGLAMLKSAAYPINKIYTANIDLYKEQVLKLSDVVNIDDNFVTTFKEGKYKPYIEGLNLEEAGALHDALDNFEGNGLIDEFKQPDAKFYFTDNSLVVSAYAIHAMGDHFEMELKFGDLEDSLLIKPKK